MKNLNKYITVVLALSLVSCSSLTSNKTASAEPAMEMHHHSHQEGPVEMDADLPIFEPSNLTFTNKADFVNSENIFIRHNTPLVNKEKVIQFYRENLPKNGWTINKEKSLDNKIAIQKGDRFATVRIFEMQYQDSTNLAFSINLVKPKETMNHNESHLIE